MNEIELRKKPSKNIVLNVAMLVLCIIFIIYFANASVDAFNKIILIGFMTTIVIGIVLRIKNNKPLLKITDHGISMYTLVKDVVLIPWDNITKINIKEEFVMNKIMGMKISNKPKALVIMEIEFVGKNIINKIINKAEGSVKNKFLKISDCRKFNVEINLTDVGGKEEIVYIVKDIINENLPSAID